MEDRFERKRESRREHEGKKQDYPFSGFNIWADDRKSFGKAKGFFGRREPLSGREAGIFLESAV